MATVLGGPHVTLVPHDARPHADSIVVGYSEDTWPELLRDFVAGAIKWSKPLVLLPNLTRPPDRRRQPPLDWAMIARR